MSEFGCDNWRLENVIDGPLVLKCPKTDADAYCLGKIPGQYFDTAERTKFAKDVLDCANCEHKLIKVLGRTSVESPYQPRPLTPLKKPNIPSNVGY